MSLHIRCFDMDFKDEGYNYTNTIFNTLNIISNDDIILIDEDIFLGVQTRANPNQFAICYSTFDNFSEDEKIAGTYTRATIRDNIDLKNSIEDAIKELCNSE